MPELSAEGLAKFSAVAASHVGDDMPGMQAVHGDLREAARAALD
ncbi:MAG TPA: hypothetical protein VN683_12210 [Acidothermaceae bacterium]|nr:hypothetical protein [Acidothermaceae bacterium]